MQTVGLVSVSFRTLSPDDIVLAAKAAGLSVIEWGSDVHAPFDNAARLKQIVKLQEKNGITCSSYGTYYRLGETDPALLPAYIGAAKALGTDVLRIWCGTKSASAYSESERKELLTLCRSAAECAEKAHVTLCIECHSGTYTDDADAALSLLQEVNSPAFRTYWQPGQYRTAEENMRYATLVAPYTKHLHVFNWQGTRKLPLADGWEVWKRYLTCFSGERTLLLEFMPDGRVESLSTEAETLLRLIGR